MNVGNENQFYNINSRSSNTHKLLEGHLQHDLRQKWMTGSQTTLAEWQHQKRRIWKELPRFPRWELTHQNRRQFTVSKEAAINSTRKWDTRSSECSEITCRHDGQWACSPDLTFFLRNDRSPKRENDSCLWKEKESCRKQCERPRINSEREGEAPPPQGRCLVSSEVHLPLPVNHFLTALTT